ncbi:MAG: PVC-type heme-binding CxxCH protein [Rubripirellula sp.]
MSLSLAAGERSYADQKLGPTTSTREVDTESHGVDESFSALRVREGYRVDAIAVEPLISDPVSARLDFRGRLWVVEMPDYPTGPRAGQGPSGRIKILEDQDSDGRYDSAILFADKLMFATGVQPYKSGAFVTLAGKILFFDDANGDGRADEQIELFEGFAEQNQQLRANHPTLGPDGLIYVAGGLRGGSIRSLHSDYESRPKPIDLRDRDFCFDPEGGYWGAIPGKSQFGVTIDDYGRRFGCSNRNPAMMTPLSMAAVDRDPLLVARDAIHDVALSAEKSEVVSRAAAWTTSNLHSGQFSAACGVFAPGWKENDSEWLLACEPTAYLVQRQRVQPDGSVWKSTRESVPDEFLASSDTWFRPVDVTAGPGQSVLIVDMARAVIEHPDFMPTELKTRPDKWDGEALGRIWRVAQAGEDPVCQPLTSAKQAVSWLESPSAWQRQSASQYLMEGADKATRELSDLVAREDGHSVARARAARLLARRESLTNELCQILLTSSDARLRTLGIELAQDRNGLVRNVLAMSRDTDPSVLRAVAAQAGAGKDRPKRRIDAMTEIATRNVAGRNDPWINRTLASAETTLLNGFARQVAIDPNVNAELLSHLIERIAMESPRDAAALLAAAESGKSGGDQLSARQVRLMSAWFRGVKKRKTSVAKTIDEFPAALQKAFSGLIDRASRTAHNEKANPSVRATCLVLISDAGRGPESLRIMIGDQSPPELRVVALPLALRSDADWTREYLEENLTGMTAIVRSSAVSACASQAGNARWLLSLIEEGTFSKAVIDPATAKRLRQHSDKAVSIAAGRLLRTDPNRAKVLTDYASSATSLGDATLGKKLFAEHCSACHRIDAVGTNVGPDISDSRTKTPEALLTSILDPNAAIDASFVQYSVLTVDGRVLDGLLIGETTEEVTLQLKGGKRVAVARDEIERLQTPGISLMPEGFEQTLKPAQMSDLLSYLKNWRYLDGTIPGSIPGRD